MKHGMHGDGAPFCFLSHSEIHLAAHTLRNADGCAPQALFSFHPMEAKSLLTCLIPAPAFWSLKRKLKSALQSPVRAIGMGKPSQAALAHAALERPYHQGGESCVGSAPCCPAWVLIHSSGARGEEWLQTGIPEGLIHWHCSTQEQCTLSILMGIATADPIQVHLGWADNGEVAVFWHCLSKPCESTLC